MILAFDPGFGNVKVAGVAGTIVVPSAVSTPAGEPGAGARMAGLRSARPPLLIRSEHGAFYVGGDSHSWGRPVENMDFDRLTGSPEMRALFYAALDGYWEIGLPRADIDHLYVGLPVASLAGDGGKRTQRAVKRWLRGAHEWQADDRPARRCYVRQVQVTSQPVGLLFDWLLDVEGAFVPARKALFKKEIGILGVGMNTVDLLVVANGRPVRRFTGGDTLGVRRLLDLCNPGQLYSLGEMDAQLRARALDLDGSLTTWGREVGGYLERQWGRQFRRFAAVIVAGGGADLLRRRLVRQFDGKAYIPDDPVIATARGLYKYGLMKERRSR